MANLQVLLKQEIQRLARKEVRTQTAQLVAAVKGQRKRIAALSEQVGTIRGELAALRRKMGKAPARGAAPEQEESSLRFRAAGFASHRKRLGLSAAQASKLLGVSSLSVYKWEAGKSHPRSSQLPAIARFRKLGKREAAALLEAAAA